MNEIIQVLSKVRFKLLTFMLKLQKEFGNSVELIDLKKNSERISTFVQQIIIEGDNNILNTGENVQIFTQVNQNDKESLRRFLLKQKIEEEDIEELIKIVNEESPNIKEKKLGIRVTQWIEKAFKKAIDGGWEIGLGLTINALTEAIKKYYGFS